MPVSSRLASIAILFGGAIWGVYWLPIKWINDLGVPEYWAIALIMLVTTAVFTPLAWHQGELTRITPFPLMLIGLSGGFAYNFYGTSFLTTDIIRAVFLFYLLPVWGALFGRIILKETIHFWRGVAIITGFLGLWLLMGGGTSTPLPQNLGDWYAFIGGVFFALCATIIRHHSNYGAFATNSAVFSFGFLVAFIQAILFSYTEFPSLQIQRQALPIAIGLVLFIILPGNYAIFWGAKYVSPTTTSIFMMAEVAVATLSAAFILGTDMGHIEWLGGVIIVSAGIIDVWGEWKKENVHDLSF